MIKIPINALKQARKLLTRLPFTRSKLPVLGHVLARTDAHGVTLAISDLDQWLETRLELSTEPRGAHAFLIPAAALATAVKADKGSEVCFLPKGRAGQRELKLVTISGGMKIETMHPTADWEDFPDRPLIEGHEVEIPAATFEALKAVASCASSQESRHVLNGVYFTPEDGGMLVATDGRRLAGAPATVPPAAGFILPNGAVHILAHPDFGSRACTVTITAQQKEKENDRVVSFQSENHLLVSRTITGDYPNWKQVVPREMVASVTIAEDRRPAIVSWLRSLRGQDGSVTLRHKKSDILQLTHATNGKEASTVEVAATQTGNIPAIALDPAYLATALEIAPTLWLTNSISPVVARRADGVFCVVMPMRLSSGAAGPSPDTKASSTDQAAA